MGSHLDWSALVVIEQDIIAILILTNVIFVFVCISSADGVAEVCMWLDPSHRQAKDNEKNSGVDGSLTYEICLFSK